MFKSSGTSSEQSLFSCSSQILGEKKLKILNEESTWFNTFYREITGRIDERIFEGLYSSGTGRPNAPIRILVAMLVLKEGMNWTDEQLYNAAGFDLQVMRALGLTNIDDEVPVPSTFYEFKSKIVYHHENTGEDLIYEVFASLTTDQIAKYKVNGKNLRMDSKLIQSHIREGSRLHKLLHGVQVFCKDLPDGWDKKIKKKADKEFLELILSKSVTNHLYKMSTDEKSKWLVKLGFLMKKLLNIFQHHQGKYYALFKQLYHDHYIEKDHNKQLAPERNQQSDDSANQVDNEDGCRPKKNEEMNSGGIQSMHDPEAAYRTKGRGSSRQQVSGYAANITETIGEDLRLITDVQVEAATHADSSFLESAVRNSRAVTGQTVEQVHTDGGYDSIENRKRFSQHIGKVWHLANTLGGKAFRFNKQDDGSVKIYDPNTDEWLDSTLSRGGNYRIGKRGKSDRYRYFKPEQVEAGIALAEVLPEQVNKGVRANVEATIHQVFHTLHGGKKSKYRGLIRHRMYAFSRAMWVNCKRIRSANITSSHLECNFRRFATQLHYLHTSIRKILQPAIHFKFEICGQIQLKPNVINLFTPFPE